MPSISYDEYRRLTHHLIQNPPVISAQRLPPSYKLGRCLFEVKGKTLISGKCAYQISDGGAFEINGSRQVFAGVDYPAPEIHAESISTDYFVQVDHEILDNGKIGSGWWAVWNGDKRATHAHEFLGSVIRTGACYSNADAKICLWKE